jgi:threonine synthase
MKYISTRGQSPAIGFEDIVTSGLAPDGGLYMPESIPKFSLKEIQSWKDLRYDQLAFRIIYPFVEGSISSSDITRILHESYKDFTFSRVAPLEPMFSGYYLLELYHGPTLAFKDFALQLLGRLLNHVLKKRREDVVIIGATSGDTGSAAIEGCKDSVHTKIFMLHPHNRTSEIQRRQMTTVEAENVFNIAAKGTFDNCQSVVKSLFQEADFTKGQKLVAVNSINWVRIMAQVVYYFSAYLQLEKLPHSIAFTVPTGNFGDIFAGYIAYKMGLPISQLVVATNANDILHRFFEHNDYSQKQVVATLSPSMDIQISSNFERLLYDIHGGDGATVSKLMSGFNKTKSLKVSADVHTKMRALFDSYSTNDAATCSVIKDIYAKCQKIVDPHTATGIDAAMHKRKDKNVPMVILATAHPAKFPDAIKKTGLVPPRLPGHMKDIMEKKERYEVLPATMHAIKDYIKNNI